MKAAARNDLTRGRIEFSSQPNLPNRNAASWGSLLLAFMMVLGGFGCSGLTSSSKGLSTSPAPAAIAVSPSSIQFGSVPVGSPASQSVTVTNIGGSSLTITQVSTAGNGLSLTGISLPLAIGAAGQANFTIVFSPKALGSVSGTVTVLSDAPASPSTVTVSGVGVSATTLLVPGASSLDFGDTNVGGHKNLSVTLTNAGNSNVTVSSVTISDPSSSYSASGISAGQVVEPAQTAELDLTFSPKSLGSMAAIATVASDATDSPATISLAGTAVQSVLHSVSLAWAASTSVVAGYNVYRSGVSGGPYGKLNSSLVGTDEYMDTGVAGGLTYYYVVTAVNAAGFEGADSPEVSATIPSP